MFNHKISPLEEKLRAYDFTGSEEENQPMLLTMAGLFWVVVQMRIPL